MTAEEKPPSGPDLSAGVAISQIPDGGMLLGHVGGEAALFARCGEEIFAIGATCTHYGGPLAEGLLVGDTVRCPWHHACFGLRDGENLRPPALNPVTSWKVIREGDRVRAGLRVDKGIVVDAYFETSAKGIFAAGDVARYPDFRTGQPVRIEHFVAAERQAQAAARNMLGTDRREPFRAVPFFWSQHYDVVLNYVGHAERWDSIDRDGSFASGSCRLTYKSGGKTLAVLTLSRDRESLEAEAAMEAG